MLLEELAHLLRSGSLLGCSPGLSSLLRDEVLKDFISSEWNWGHNGSLGNLGSVMNEVSLMLLGVVMDFAVFKCLDFSVLVALLMDSISAVSKGKEDKIGKEGDQSLKNGDLSTSINLLVVS